jgi:2-polyprenyl-3-methyl-5-hydroxy-6-metoxy-1,4-benzoquinol methylase
MDKYQVTFQTWNKLAQAYQDKFMDLDLYDDTYDLFCSFIKKPQAKIFEIGCGPGNITRYLLAKRPDFKIEAIDVAPTMVELAKKNNPAASFITLDCREIDTLTSTYDGIMCGFCLPYLSKEDCAKLVKDCSKLLNTGGILYVSAIEGNYSKSGMESGSTGDQAYVYYHEAAYLKDHLCKNNFELVELKRKSYPKSPEENSIHIIFVAKKGS